MRLVFVEKTKKETFQGKLLIFTFKMFLDLAAQSVMIKIVACDNGDRQT